MAGHRCYIKSCSEDIVQRVLEYLSFQDKAQLSLTCKAFATRHLAGPLEVYLGKHEEVPERKLVRVLLQMLHSMPAQQRSKIRELRMYSYNSGIAELPDSQQHRVCRALISNLTVLRLHDVHLRLETLESPGIEQRLEVLDLSGSVLIAKGHPRELKWSLLTSNSPTLKCLILRNALVHIPNAAHLVGCHYVPFKHVVLPGLEELDIVHFEVRAHKPSGSRYFEERQYELSRSYPRALPPQCFQGAPRLTTLRFSLTCQRILPRAEASNWDHFPNLRSAELIHEPWEFPLPFERLPLSLTELSVRLMPVPRDKGTRESYGVSEYFKLMMKAASAGMQLHKLTLVGFTYYDVSRLASKAEGLCLEGIRELVLEPNFSDAAHKSNIHPVDLILHVFPDLEKLHIGGQQCTSLILTVPCLLLKELSLSFCPASIFLNCANLSGIRLQHRYSNVGQRAVEMHELDMTAWACGQLDCLTVLLGSYRMGDVFHVQCKPGTAVSATMSYSAEKWGPWVIGVKLGAGTLGLTRQSAVRFECSGSYGALNWGLA